MSQKLVLIFNWQLHSTEKVISVNPLKCIWVKHSEVLHWVKRTYQFQKIDGKFILFLNLFSWTCSGHMKYILLTYNYMFSHWEVSLHQRIKQPLFKDYPKNITKIVQARGSHLRLYQEALQKWASQISLIYFIAKSLAGGVLISGWRADPAKWCYQLTTAVFQARSDYRPKTHPVVSSVQCFQMYSHKAPDHSDASYFHTYLISTNLHSFYTHKSSSDWL